VGGAWLRGVIGRVGSIPVEGQGAGEDGGGGSGGRGGSSAVVRYVLCLHSFGVVVLTVGMYSQSVVVTYVLFVMWVLLGWFVCCLLGAFWFFLVFFL